MHICIAKVKIILPENHSLKGKRKVVKSLISRIQNKYNVSVSEVGEPDLLQLAEIGLTCASNSQFKSAEIITGVLRFIDSFSYEYEVIESLQETITSF
tara:strand:+ start:189 stop:482 length:294 start_codon:yes stop_codon:yes gene_type:complete